MKKISYLIVLILFIVIIYELSFTFLNKKDYTQKLLDKTVIYVTGKTAKRGRILDTNGKVIVDSQKVNTIFYHKTKNISKQQELSIANELSKYLKNNVEDKVKYIYNKLSKGYSYDIKTILSDLSDEDYAKILEKNLPGIYGDYTWKRSYPYKDTLKSILGTIGTIPSGKESEYLNKGYKLDDTVGISYLEYQYDEYLKGINAIYAVNQKDGTLKLIKEEKEGSDLVLSIDIDKQLEIENVLKENISKAKQQPNTNYYKESYVILSNPNDGSIIAMAGKRYNKENDFTDVTNNIINTSYVMGSVVKGATISVGYKYNIIDIGTKMQDSCIKLYNVPQKCSFKKLGVINDIQALEKSSNYYQFKIAIGITNNTYSPNIKLNSTIYHFNIYRDILKEYGLGDITGIDLPNEQKGIISSKIADDLLLNLSIGQYDTYTPIELAQYINTIANNGYRYKPTLMKKISNNNKTIIENHPLIQNKISLDSKYINRIKEGLNKVLISGTGRGYINKKLNPAGKTGTSESYYDSDNDGKVDTLTITKTFAGFFPYDDPEYSLVVISPNVSYKNDTNSYISNVNRQITSSIANFLFDI